MTPLRFRVWDKANKQWANRLNCAPAIVWDDGLNGCFTIRADDYIIMHFTGLTDKNGKEIFQSDLVVDSDGGYDPIVWETAGWYWGELPLGDFESNQLEVIGNVYENPELLPTK